MSNIRLSKDQVDEVVEYLEGSSNSLYDVFDHIGVQYIRVDSYSLNAIHARVFKCEHCEDWCPDSDNSGSDTCTDCNDSMLDEEDEEEYDEDDDDDLGDEDA